MVEMSRQSAARSTSMHSHDARGEMPHGPVGCTVSSTSLARGSSKKPTKREALENVRFWSALATRKSTHEAIAIACWCSSPQTAEERNGSSAAMLTPDPYFADCGNDPTQKPCLS